MRLPACLAAPLLKCFRNNSAILMYHGVTGPDDARFNLLGKHVPVETFAEQMTFFKRNFEILPLEYMLQSITVGRYPRNSLAITFDDGYRNFYWHAYPVLQNMALPATVFLATGFINAYRWALIDGLEYAIMSSERSHIAIPGQAAEVPISSPQEKLTAISLAKKIVKSADAARAESLADKIRLSCGGTLPAPFGNYQFLRWAEVREMAAQGIHFGPHTVNHIILARCSAEKAAWEIVESKQEIERQTGQSCSCFCYPNGMLGDYNEAIKAICARHFSYAFSARLGILRESDADRYEMRRIGLTQATTVASLINIMLKLMIKNSSLLSY